MLLTSLIGALLATSIAISSVVPSDETLKIAFDRGQRFYVIEDYDQAIEKFLIVESSQDSRFVDETQVLIEVGNFSFPVKVAAIFQLANSYRSLAVDQLKNASQERDESRAASLREQAAENFTRASHYYRGASKSTDLLEIRVLSQYQLVKTNFQSSNYAAVIEEAGVLLENFPESDYVDEALYELGWAHFSLGQFPEAIAAFERLDRQGSAADYRIDRAQFQVGKSYFEQKKYTEARSALGKLIGKYDFSDLSEAERVKLETSKLSGVVKETAVELVAKAQLLIGDSFTAEGDIDGAAAAYRQVITEYSQERDLVEEAYVKIGEAYFAQNDLEGGIQVYRRSIDEVSSQGFRARMQARIARIYYDERRFPEATADFRIYITAYGELSSEGGLPIDRARFLAAQSLFEAAETVRQAGDDSQQAYATAQSEYESVSSETPTTELKGESLFGAGLSAQRRGGTDGLQQAFELFERVRNEFTQRQDLVARALLQSGRAQYLQKDFSSAVDTYEEFVRRFAATEDVPQALFEVAIVHRDADQPTLAVAAFDRIPPTDKVWRKAGLAGGDFLLRLGDLERAETYLERSRVAHGEDAIPPALAYILGRVYFEQDRLDESVDAFSTAIDIGDTEAISQGALLGRGTAYYTRQDLDLAIVDLEQLLAMSPAANLKDQAHRLLGQCYMQMGRREEAIEDYREIIAASTSSAERAEFTLLLAELHYSLGRYEDALAACEELLQSDFDDSASQRGYLLKERAYFVIGDIYTRTERQQEARDTFALALREFPQGALRADLLFGRAVATFSLGENEEAISLLASFIEDFDTNTNLENAHYFLAYAHLQETNFSEAADWFGRLATRWPDSSVAAEALFQQGENLFNLGRFDEAAVAYRAILENFSESEFVDNASYNLGWCHFEGERPEEAIQQFQELLRNFPSSPLAASVQFTLGDHFFNNKDYDQAETAYSSVISHYPESELVPQAQKLMAELSEIKAYLRYEEAMALFDSEDYARAAVALEEVVQGFEKTETRAGALANLGMSYENMRQWKDASRIYGVLVSDYEGVSESAAAVVFAQEHLNWIVTNRL
ncbi:MAG: tetratricopeptide repeat protein [Chloroflexi bacterium]|nr:tetratricopeptide repeat protein [Chloroflexota bacterium]